MSENRNQLALARSLRRHGFASAILVLLLFAGCGAWASLVEIGGAVIAPGRIAVESSVKRVQHEDGGTIAEIRVREGMEVAAGDLLVRLDDTIAQAEAEIVAEQLTEALALEARLIAERDHAPTITPWRDFAHLDSGPRARQVVAGQATLMAARRTSIAGRKAQLNEQIVQDERKIAGLTAQRDAKEAEIALIADELADLEGLLAKGLVAKSRVTALRRDKARLEGEHGGFVASIAETEAAIGERRIELLRIDEEHHAEIVAELQEVRGRIAELAARRTAALDRLRRVDIRAPRAGMVHKLAVHTIGGVIRPGEDLMEIVPREDRLVVEARIRPTDIEQIWSGQSALVRLPAFNQRSTPELQGRIETVTSDLIQERDGEVSYYRARLLLPDEELARLGDRPLVSGMPVEIFIATGMRTALSYLLKPVTDQLAHAWREE